MSKLSVIWQSDLIKHFLGVTHCAYDIIVPKKLSPAMSGRAQIRIVKESYPTSITYVARLFPQLKQLNMLLASCSG
jgi:hypothetical protein